MKILDLTELAAIDLNPSVTYLVADVDGVSDVTRKLKVSSLPFSGSQITYSETTVPADGSAVGLYSVQTGTNRGLYMSSGVGSPYLLLAYAEDGGWPAP